MLKFQLFSYNIPMSMKLIRGVYVADTARVLGEVELGADVNIWYGVSIRGDVARVVVGEGTNIQDNAVVHCDHKFPNIIGRYVTIGHNAVIHGESIGDGSLIGIGRHPARPHEDRQGLPDRGGGGGAAGDGGGRRDDGHGRAGEGCSAGER